MDMIIYQGGLTTMQGELLVAGVTVEIDGVLKRCQNITVVDDGVIRMKEMYDTEGKPTKVWESKNTMVFKLYCSTPPVGGFLVSSGNSQIKL